MECFQLAVFLLLTQLPRLPASRAEPAIMAIILGFIVNNVLDGV